MSGNWARFLAGIASIAIIWIAAYWWLNPRPDKISFGGGPAQAGAPSPETLRTAPASHFAPPPQPRPAPKIVDVKRDVKPAAPPPSAGSPPVQLPPVEPPVVPPVSPPAVIPPKFENYTIKSGDTLTSIATSRLGSIKHIDAIRRSNPLKDLDKLKTGDVIKLPIDPANIQGKPASTAPPPAPPPERQGEMLEYTVKNGDTLSKIAKDQYGSTKYQDMIYQANRDRLKSPSALKEGQKLRLPKKTQ